MDPELIKNIVSSAGVIGGAIVFCIFLIKAWRENMQNTVEKLKIRTDGETAVARERSIGMTAYEDMQKKYREINQDINALQKTIHEMREDNLKGKEELQDRLDKLKTHFEQLTKVITSKP